MNQFLPNSPDAGGGPVSLQDIIGKVAESHLDTTEDFINRLAEWRAYGAITDETYYLADKALMQQADHLRTVMQVCGQLSHLAIR